MLPSSVLLAAAATWTVDPASACHELGDRTGAEVRRGCAAARTCSLAPPESAERRAILTCTGDEMIVDALARDGRRLWTLTVSGEPADRARQVAVWIARSDEMPEPEPEAARKPVDEAPARPPDVREKAPAKPLPVSPSGVTVALLVTEVPGQTNRTVLANAAGVQLGAAFALGRGVYAGPLLSFERATHLREAEPPVGESVPLFRAGGRLGWGAPWSAGVIGAYLDLGFGLWWASETLESAAKPSLAVPYAAPTIVVQYPSGDLRPFAALSGVALLRPAHGLPLILGAAMAAGVAWSAF